MRDAVHIVGLGLDHHAAGSGFREGVAAGWGAGVAEAGAGGGAVTGVALCTCLRVEAYLAAADPAGCAASVVRTISARAGVPPEDLEARLAVRTGRAAVEHLFSVAAGL